MWGSKTEARALHIKNIQVDVNEMLKIKKEIVVSKARGPDGVTGWI